MARWAFLILVMAQLAGCATTRVFDDIAQLSPAPLTETILVLDDGWHTEIALPASSLDATLGRHIQQHQHVDEPGRTRDPSGNRELLYGPEEISRLRYE